MLDIVSLRCTENLDLVTVFLDEKYTHVTVMIKEMGENHFVTMLKLGVLGRLNQTLFLLSRPLSKTVGCFLGVLILEYRRSIGLKRNNEPLRVLFSQSKN